MCRSLILMLTLALVPAALADDRAPRPPSPAAFQAATRNGKYADLLKWLEVSADYATYGEIYDWGFWAGTEWAGHQVPVGYWVYVFPHWFIFKRQAKNDAPVPPRRWENFVPRETRVE